jgi:hypothetical protein
MKRFLIPVLSVLALALFLEGCEKAVPPKPDEHALFQVIDDNAQAFEKKDIDAVMATIHPQSPDFAGTRTQVADLFQKVEVTLKFTQTNMKVVESSPEEAKVSFQQTTSQVDGDKTVPLNIIDSLDTLRPDNGKWKIFRTASLKITRLKQPNDANSPSAPQEAAPAPEPAPSPAPPAEPKPAAPEKPAP